VKTAYSWGMLIAVNCAITKQKLKHVPIRLKIPLSYLKGKALLMLQKILSPARDPLTPVVTHYGIFWQKRKGKRLHNLPGREDMMRS